MRNSDANSVVNATAGINAAASESLHITEIKRVMTGIGLIVAADEPALFFETVQIAERFIEPIDVQDGVYTEAYGPTGQPYLISTDGTKVRIYESGEPPQPEKLKLLIVRYFAAIGETVQESDPLPTLLERCKMRDW